MFFDTETKNESFINVSKQLEAKEIKNNNFMLKTEDDDLKGVNPYDENLTDEMKEKIYEECKKNIWYFLREVVRIPQCGENISFKLTLSNCAQIYTDLYRVKTITIVPRQFGKTTAELCFGLWLSLFYGRDVVVKSYDSWYSKSLKKRILDFKDVLPTYLRKKLSVKIYASKDADKYFDCMMILDDVALMKDIKDVKIDNSMIISMPTCTGILRKGNCGEFVFRLAKTGILWDDKCYDYDPINFKAAGMKYVLIRYNYKDLITDEETEVWAEEMYQILGKNREVFDREVLCKWTTDKTKNGGR